MTDAEMNMKIAERLGYTQCSPPNGCFWNLPGEPVDAFKAERPPDFINDPACTVMLQRRILEAGWTVTLVPAYADGQIGMDLDRDDESISLCAPMNRMWVEAFLRMEGVL